MIEFLNHKPIKVAFKQKRSLELFETIKIENGEAKNLAYHQWRVDFAFRNYYKTEPSFSLQEHFHNLPSKGIYRAKLIYNQEKILSLEFFPYTPKRIKTIMLIENPLFEYRFKYLNRDFFEYLYQNFEADEFIITKNGFLKEFSIGNLALYKNSKNKWYTPAKPFLLGTTLYRFLKTAQLSLTIQNIYYKDLKNYSKIALMNAMLDCKEFLIKGKR